MDLKRWSEFYYIKVLLLFCMFGIVSPEITCLTGLKMPGYTVPQGDITIEYGKPLDIMCVLNETQNNASLSFVRNSQEIPSAMVDVINSTVIQLHIEKPYKVSGDTYTCLRNNTVVCMNRVIVGTKPQPVTDFQCIGYNYDNLTCTWTAPENYVKTTYNLSFALGGRSARYDNPCPSVKLSETSNQMSCFWNVSTTPPYRQVHETYNFTLVMTNPFGRNHINKMFSHFAHILSGPPENLTAISTTPSSIYLSWTVPLSMQTFQPGVHQRILYQCEYGEKKWHDGGLITNTSKTDSPGPSFFNLTGLKYAHALCDIRVSLRSAKALPNDESMWSKNASITVRTSSKLPDEPPETNAGSFEIVASGTSLQNREAYIYWKQILEEQKNGPEFRYLIAVRGNDSLKPIELTNTFARFQNLSISKNYIFDIWSQNTNGTSIRKSTVFIPKQAERVRDPLTFTKVELGDGEYELTWDAPKLPLNQYITNYTIFSCRNERDRPYQCNGMLNWTVVPSVNTTITMTVEKDKIFQFAISVNTPNSSSGMLWAACTVIHNKNMGKMKNVGHGDIGSTFIELLWKLDCSDRIGSVQGYVVYYCPIKSPTLTECKAPQANRTFNSTFNGTTVTGGNITDLHTYTTYMLTVSVITRHTTFSQQSDPLYITTLEAPPSSPPLNLKAASVTNTTIHLTWDPPEAINGVLRYYQLEYSNGSGNVEVRVEHKEDYEMTNLRSYENYTITLAACTVLCSNRTDPPLRVRTSMGYPSKTLQPTVDRRNDTSITITWNPPSAPGGRNDYYLVRLRQKYKYENKTFEYSTKVRKYVIEHCGDDGKFNTFYISVKAVNIYENTNKTYEGPWSDELENYCETPFNYIMYILLFVVIAALVGIGFLFNRLYHHCKLMRDVEVKLPPGLAPVVADHTLVPWSTEKHQESRASHSPPDEELLLVKMTEGRHFSGDSSGCSSGHESVTSSLESGTHISSSSDSGTEQAGNYCTLGVDTKVDSSYIPVTTSDMNKVPYKPCDVSSESSPYVMTGEAVKTVNPGYIPFNQTEPIGKSSGYVVAGVKNCNGYIPFNQTDPVNRNTGYVVAGIKNCKID